MRIKNPVANSFFLAFSMFSRIPMPTAEWNEKNMRWMMCFFPLVGFLIAAVEFFLCFLRTKFAFVFSRSDFVFSLFFTLAPIFVTGGIHMDGFMDVCDALGSHAPPEKKLEIMKDSHSGAFAVIGAVLYILSFFVFGFEFVSSHCPIKPSRCAGLFSILLIFVVSRALSSIAVATFPIAKNSGLVRTFSDSSAKKFTRIWCVAILIACYATMIFFAGIEGIAIFSISLGCFAWYHVVATKNFGGITGDTAGWFVQMCEILCLAGVLIV